MSLIVFGKVKLTRVTTPGTNSENVLVIEWTAGPVNDMLADACLAITLRVDALSGKKSYTPLEYSEMSEPKVLENKHNSKFKTRLESLLSMQYGEVLKDSDTRWRIEIADKIFVKIDLETLKNEFNLSILMIFDFNKIYKFVFIRRLRRRYFSCRFN